MQTTFGPHKFTCRGADEEEYRLFGWEYVPTCEMPCDGQYILIEYREAQDERERILLDRSFHTQSFDGCAYSLESGLMWRCVKTWVPLPENM